MGGSKRVLSPKFADFDTVLCRQESKSPLPILVPISEGEWATKCRVANSGFGGDRPRPVETEIRKEAVTEPAPQKSIDLIRNSHEFARVDTVEPQIHQFRDAQERDIAAIPDAERPLHAFSPSKENSSFSGWFVTASAALALMAGTATGVIWSWKSAPSSNTAASERLIFDRLNAITRELSSLRHDLTDLAASQRHVAEKQEQLSAAQDRLSVAQNQATAKQDHVPSTRTSRLRKTTRP